MFIYKNKDYIIYANLLEKILLSLSILYNYKEMIQAFKYIYKILFIYFYHIFLLDSILEI